VARGVSDDGRDVRRTWERFEESNDTSLGRGTDSRMNANTTLVRRFTAPERMVKSSVRTSQRSVSRAKSRGAKSRTAICTLKNAEGSQSGLLEIFLKIYFPKTSYEYFDSSWMKIRAKSCTPHSRVSIGPPYVSSEIACGSNHSPPWKWGLGTHETWVKSLSLCGLWGLEGTRRYLSPSREVAAAIPRSREGAATHAGVDRRWHAVCDTEGIDERHTGARLHGGTRDPRRGVTEGQSRVWHHRPREIVPGRAEHRRDTRARGPYFPGLSR